MNNYLPRLTAISLAFLIGISAVGVCLFQRKDSNPAHKEEVTETAPLLINSFEYEPDSTPKYDSETKVIPLTKHSSFEDVISTLKHLADFQNKKGTQTFHISSIRKEGGNDYAYAYWVEDKSITILNFPVSSQPTDSELYWLSGKARIDLAKDVVPTGKYENLGCCLVERDFADKILRWCKAGYKLRFTTR